MVILEKLHQNLSDDIQFCSKNDLNLIRKGIISSEKMRNSVNVTYDYATSSWRLVNLMSSRFSRDNSGRHPRKNS